MSSEHEHSADEFARRLVTLTPAATLTRDQVLYEAGRHAGRKEARPWRFAASVMTVGMIGFLAFETWNGTTSPMAWVSPQRRTEQQPQVESSPTTVESTLAFSGRNPNAVEAADYLRLRDLVLERGVDAMPRPAVASASPKKADLEPRNDDIDRAWWRLRVKQMGGASL
jgi:hypothetical protein